MKIKKCRLCASNKFSDLFSLGSLSFTGKFTKSIKTNIPKDYLNLVICKKCKLVQLDRSFNPNYLYSNDYGYRTGINKTMTKHVHLVTKEAVKLATPSKNDFVLDIASNDATLLNFYDKKLKTVGVDPLIQKHKKFYKKIDYKLSDFFSYNLLKKNNLNKKYKIVTALSMFYDLNNPDSFIKDIVKILHKEGIFILEHADLLSIIKNCLFDTICHEHLEYYSLRVVKNLLESHGMKLLDVETNSVNGGSFAVTAALEASPLTTNDAVIAWLLEQEDSLGLDTPRPYAEFSSRVFQHRKDLQSLVRRLGEAGKTVAAYGASTKGNVLLQFCGFGPDDIAFIAEVNPEKFGCFTPGSLIPIISEEEARAKKPDYMLVLPWHFRDFIVNKEQDFLAGGGRLIFPLPEIEIVS